MNIFLDIETKPTSRKDIQERLIATVKYPTNYKSSEAIAKWWAENGEAQKAAAVGETALNGLWGEICCIGWAIEDGPVMVTLAITERDTLSLWAKDFLEAMRGFLPDGGFPQWDSRATWIGHNVQDFDLKFLWQRLVVQNLHLGFRLPLDRYPRGPWLYDTMKEWAGYGKYVKQTDLELAFNLTRNDPLKNGGADIAAADITDICTHCSEDVRLLREIHKRMVTPCA